MEEYLTIAEVAARLKIKPKTVKNKMASGIFQKRCSLLQPARTRATIQVVGGGCVAGAEPRANNGKRRFNPDGAWVSTWKVERRDLTLDGEKSYKDIMSGNEFRKLRRAMGLSQDELSKID